MTLLHLSTHPPIQSVLYVGAHSNRTLFPLFLFVCVDWLWLDAALFEGSAVHREQPEPLSFPPFLSLCLPDRGPPIHPPTMPSFTVVHSNRLLLFCPSVCVCGCLLGATAVFLIAVRL